MSTSLDRSAGPRVRPRYTDAEVTDPLPLGDRFQEALEQGAAFVVRGPRGAGITSALGFLADEARAAGRAVVALPATLPPEPPAQALLVADLSVTPLDPERLRALAEQPLPESWARVPLLIGENLGGEARLLLRGRPAVEVRLAAWGQDDLIELLGAAPYRAERGEILARLHGLEGLGPALGRPWAVRRLVEAVRGLGPAPTLGQVYGRVLEGLAPTTLDVLRALSGSALTRRDLAQFPLELPVPDAEELSVLLQTSREVAEHMVREDAPTPVELDRGLGVLLLPGLASYVQAEDCLRWLGEAEEPPPVRAEWVPFFRALATDALLAQLAAWLADPDPPLRADGALATVLHACGRELPLGARRLLLRGAVLDGLEAPGADLSGAEVENASLAGAALVGSDLRGSSWSQCNLGGLDARGARLEGSWWRGSACGGGNFGEARARGARWEGCDLPQSGWAAAQLVEAQFEDCDLVDADFSGADASAATLARSALSGAQLGGDWSRARFEELDLRPAQLQDARLVGARFSRCALGGVRFAGAADESEWERSDLSRVDFAGASLRQARFARCLLAGADFSGCDLREALFSGVRFEPLEPPAPEDAGWQPEAPRASFCDADLRGACLEGSLQGLDLRGATLDPELHARAERDGALLDP